MPRPLTAPLAGLLTAAATVATLTTPAQALRTDDDVVAATTSAPSGTLLSGCRTYPYSYAVQVPTEDWSLEISIVDRRGHSVGSNVFIGPQDAKTAASTFRTCRASTVPGRFRIRSVLNWYDDPSTPIAVPVPVTRFRLARP